MYKKGQTAPSIALLFFSLLDPKIEVKNRLNIKKGEDKSKGLPGDEKEEKKTSQKMRMDEVLTLTVSKKPPTTSFFTSYLLPLNLYTTDTITTMRLIFICILWGKKNIIFYLDK